jgi:NAD(P)-dependent dehydrogenase (short-subunit alcohol dehydrogenase family)
MKSAVIITGAAGGIGQVLCREFTKAGYHVIASDRSEECPLAEVDSWVGIDLDHLCRKSDYRRRMVEQLREAAEGFNITALVNNAGIQVVKSVESLSVEDWTVTLNVNLMAPFLLTQALLTDLESNAGSVVNISSIHASQTKPEFTAYATSKAALNGLTKSLAVELGSRVRINNICPAAISTPMLVESFAGKENRLDELGEMHPVGRIGKPQEVASLVLFLASDAARFITGTNIVLDGGISIRLRDPV